MAAHLDDEDDGERPVGEQQEEHVGTEGAVLAPQKDGGGRAGYDERRQAGEH
jgi:hypothetical protein